MEEMEEAASAERAHRESWILTPRQKALMDQQQPTRIITSTVMEVTPEQAQRWLETNKDNRPIVKQRVHAMRQDILEGRWELNHQGICFDENWTLIDGQHRLQAIVEAQKSISILVTIVPGAKMTDVIDRGSIRKLSFITKLSNHEVAVIRALKWLEEGSWENAPLSPSALLAIADHHELGLKEVGSNCDHGFNRSIAAACAFAAPIVESSQIEQAIEKIKTGADIGAGSPFLAWRNTQLPNARGRKLTAWGELMRACNCLAYGLAEKPLKGVTTSTVGYQAIATKRRVMKIPFTPSASAVPAYSLF